MEEVASGNMDDEESEGTIPAQEMARRCIIRSGNNHTL